MLISETMLMHILAAQPRRPVPHARLQHSAVMMILIDREVQVARQTQLVFIMKTRDGSRHAGQIAFPGGKVEPGESFVLAALRETREEIGVAHEQLEVRGNLGYFSTMTTGYDAEVFVARPRAPLQYAPQTGEVAAIFEIPLGALWQQFDPSWQIQKPVDMLRLHFHLPSGPYLRAQSPVFPLQQKHLCIWGFTARVLQYFLQLKFRLAS